MKKLSLLLLGHLFLSLGIIGAFLPILPTTPFLLLAVFCYSKSSQKLHFWILNHKYLGPPVKAWEQNGVIGLKAKILATVMLSLVIIFQLPYLNIAIVLKVSVITILILVLIFVWSRPSKIS
ncbi:MAG: YbaN family protein [Bacteriovorax sp.]|nr:YbaN family protein [Bacteriovorax sp.]